MKTKITLVAGENPASVRFPEATRFQAATADSGRPATFAMIRQALADVGVDCRRITDTREIRVNLKGGKEATAYYATDLDDALGTGLAMAEWKAAR